jgi:hypothetical protein
MFSGVGFQEILMSFERCFSFEQEDFPRLTPVDWLP